MAEQGKGLYDHQYGRFRENQGTHQGYEFQHGPAGSVPPRGDVHGQDKVVDVARLATKEDPG